jgi:hypothetical protein
LTKATGTSSEWPGSTSGRRRRIDVRKKCCPVKGKWQLVTSTTHRSRPVSVACKVLAKERSKVPA